MVGDRLPVDHEARAKASTELSRSMCVEAGAGTGKTTILVSRFLSIIESGAAGCGQIVAITFTEKAAAEMKEKLRGEVERRLLSGKCSGKVRARLEDALFELERSVIGTIHSFASHLIREFPIEAGVDPYFSQLDEVESEVILDRCWEDFVGGMSEADGLAVRWYLVLGGSAAKLKGLAWKWYRSRVLRAATGIFKGGKRSSAIGDEDFTNPASRLSMLAAMASEFREYLRRKSRELVSIAESFCMDRSDRGYVAISKFAEDVGSAEVLDGEDLVEFLASMSIPRRSGSKSKWKPPGKCTEQKEIFREISGKRDAFCRSVMDALKEALVPVLERFAETVGTAKDSRGSLDFDDLLVRARRLLEKKEVRGALRKKYRYILVDEFQDTDPIQSEIIYLLSLDEDGDGRISPGKLFIVGDPKQSIYRFRGADVEVYESFKSRVAESGEILKIVQNFRSVPGIIDWVNSVFSKVIRAPEDGSYQSEYEPIHPFREGEGVSVVYLDTLVNESGGSKDEVRRVEAEAVARAIHHLVGSDCRVFDRERGEYVPVDYRHIAVIYPATTGIEYYEEVLKLEEIPYIVEGGKMYFARQEVRELSAAMWAVEDPCDYLSVVSVFRSSIFGFSDEDILLYRVETGGLKAVEKLDRKVGRLSQVLEALRLLDELHERRNLIGAYGVMKELVERTSFMELSSLRPHGEQKVLNILKALQKARKFDSTGYPFRRFARWFGEQEREIHGEGESPVVEENDNAVRMLTIHKAKGLQFPVVVMANLIQGFARAPTAFVVDGWELEFRLNDTLSTPGYEEAREEEKKREEAEMARLLYVAATRAQDILILPVQRLERGRGYIDILSSSLPPDRSSGGVRGDDGDADGGKDTMGEAREEGGRGRAGRYPVERWVIDELPPLRGTRKAFVRMPERRAFDEALTLKKVDEWLEEHNRIIEKGSEILEPVMPVTTFERESPGAGVIAGDSAGVEERRALDVGLVFHKVMELVDPSGGSDVKKLSERLCLGFNLEESVQEVYELAKKALESEIIRSIFSSKDFYREVPFVFPVGRGYISGRIDLLYRSGGCWNILDYKTDAVRTEDVEGKAQGYRIQAGMYVLALERLGLPPGEVVLYFVRPDAFKVFGTPDEIADAALKALGGSLRARPGQGKLISD